MKPAPFDWHAPVSAGGSAGAEGAPRRGGALPRRRAEPGAGDEFPGGPAGRAGRPEPRAPGWIGIEAAPRRAADRRHGAQCRGWSATRRRRGASRCSPRRWREVAHPQIRNRGTLGGNLSHADPASEMPAVMLALGARIAAAQRAAACARWRRRDFFLGPLTTALAPDEMLAEIRIPPLPPRTGTAFLESRAAARRLRDDGRGRGGGADAAGRCAAARLACCSAGPTPMAAPRAAGALVGNAAGRGRHRRRRGAAARGRSTPTGSVQASPAYQRHLAGVLAARAPGARGRERAA